MQERHHANALSKVARRASVMKKRKFSKNKFDLSGLTNHIDRKESESSIVFMSDELKTASGTNFFFSLFYFSS